MKIETKQLTIERRWYDFKIIIEGFEYYFICETLTAQNIDCKEFVVKINRGKTYWDCKKRLKNSDRKKVNGLIKLTIEHE